LQFDAVDDYVDIQQMIYDGSLPVTFSAWIKPINSTLDGTANVHKIVDQDSSYGNGLYIAYNLNPNRILFLHDQGSCTSTWTPSSVAELEQWHYVVGTWNGTNQSLWVDGVMKASMTCTGIQFDNVSVKIGGGASGRYFNGTIDEVKIYNRALSAAEILSEYQSATPTTTTTTTTTTIPPSIGFASFSFSTKTNQLNVNWFTEYSGGTSVSVVCRLNGVQNCLPYPYTDPPGGGSCTIASPSYDTTPDPSGLPRTVANQLNCTAYDTGTPAVKYEKLVYFYPRAIEVSLPTSMSLVVGEEQDLLITVKNNGTLSDSYGISVTPTTLNLLTVADGSQITQVLGTNDVQQAHVGLTLLATGQPATANVVVSSGSQAAIHFDMPVSVKGTEKSLPEFGAAGIMQIIAAAALLAIFLF